MIKIATTMTSNHSKDLVTLYAKNRVMHSNRFTYFQPTLFFPQRLLVTVKKITNISATEITTSYDNKDENNNMNKYDY